MRLIIVILAAMLAGCSALRQQAINMKVPDKAARAVDEYGQNIPFSERIQNREAINDLTEFCDIRVDCEGDPE